MRYRVQPMPNCVDIVKPHAAVPSQRVPNKRLLLSPAAKAALRDGASICLFVRSFVCRLKCVLRLARLLAAALLSHPNHGCPVPPQWKTSLPSELYASGGGLLVAPTLVNVNLQNNVIKDITDMTLGYKLQRIRHFLNANWNKNIVNSGHNRSARSPNIVVRPLLCN